MAYILKKNFITNIVLVFGRIAILKTILFY